MPEPIEIEGKKFVQDPENEGEPLKDDEGNPIPYEEVEGEEGDEEDNSEDISSYSFDELKNKIPEVAKLVEEKQKQEQKLKEIEEERKKREERKKEEEGKWKELLEDKKKEVSELVDEKTKLKNLLAKHKETISTLLSEVEKTVPEDRKSLIPQEFSKRQRFEYIVKNAELLGAKVALNKGGSVPPNQDEPPMDEEAQVQQEFNELMSKERNLTPSEQDKAEELAKKLKEIRKRKD